MNRQITAAINTELTPCLFPGEDRAYLSAMKRAKKLPEVQQDKTFADAVAFLEVCFKERVKEGERTGSNRNEGSLGSVWEAMQCAEALENLIESDAWSGTDHLLCRLNSLTGVIEGSAWYLENPFLA